LWGRSLGGFGAGGVGSGRTLGLEAFKVDEGAVVGAVEGGEAALNAEEPLLGTIPADAGDNLLVDRAFLGPGPGLDFVVPNEGFDAAHAAEEPIGMNEGVDGGLFAGADGAAGGLVFADEVVEGFGGLAVDEEGLGVDAGFDGVEGGGGFSGGGGGSGGFLRITAIRFDLSLSGHAGSEIARRHGVPDGGCL